MFVSSSAADADFENIVPGPRPSKEIESATAGAPLLPSATATSSFERKPTVKRTRASPIQWTAEMTNVLLHEIIKEIKAGKRSDNGFKMNVWDEVSAAVKRVAPKEPITGKRCQGRQETLRNKWNKWTRLRGLSGMGWDETKGMITAPDEVWEMEIEVYSSPLLFSVTCLYCLGAI